LQIAMGQATQHQRQLAVVYLDLDGFKAYNDHYGHEAGDQLLIELGHGLQSALRPGDTLARLGGDEFVAVLPDLSSALDSLPVLEALLAAAAKPLSPANPMPGHALSLSASLGVSFYPQADPVDADQLLRQADQAMFQAKQSGKNRYHFFDTEGDRGVRSRHAEIERIALGLKNHEFVLFYQPKGRCTAGS